MEPELHPAIRRITWLIIGIGAVTLLAAVLLPLFNIKTGIDSTTPFVLGLLWLVVGLVVMRWLRPVPGRVPVTDNIVDSLSSINLRMGEMEKTLQAMQTRIESWSNVMSRLNTLDHELDNLATTVQDVHAQLDGLSDTNNRLHELETQLDSLYVTLHDTHKRIDDLEQAGRHS